MAVVYRPAWQNSGLFMHMTRLCRLQRHGMVIKPLNIYYTTSTKALADQDGCLHILDCILPFAQSPHSGMLHGLVGQCMFCDRDSVEEGLRLSEECS